MGQQTDSFSTSGSSQATSGKFIDKLKDDGLQRVRSGQRTAADQLEGVADAIERAGAELDERQPTLAAYAGQLAGGVSNFATRLREGSLDQLATDTQRFAKSNPGLFLLGSVGVGIMLSRFLKASASQRAAEGEWEGNVNEESYADADSEDTFDVDAADPGAQAASATYDRATDDATEQNVEGYGAAGTATRGESNYRRGGGIDA